MEDHKRNEVEEEISLLYNMYLDFSKLELPSHHLALGCIGRSGSRMRGRYKHDRTVRQVGSTTSMWRSGIVHKRLETLMH